MHSIFAALRSLNVRLHDLFVENVNLLLALFLICAIGTLLLQLPTPSTIFASPVADPEDATATDYIRNPGFEESTNGNHLKPWGKFPSTANVYAETLKPHSGSWNGAMEANGVWTTLRQKVNVTPEHLYSLNAWVSTTHGDPGNLIWFSNVTGDQACAYSTAIYSQYTLLNCSFDIPYGTTGFKVKLKNNAQPNRWVVFDDFDLIDLGPSNVSPRVQAFSSIQRDSITAISASVYTGTPVVGPNYYDFSASPVSICGPVGCSLVLAETGFFKGGFTQGQLKQFFAYKYLSGLPTNRFDNEVLLAETWYDFSTIYNPSTLRWEWYRGTQIQDSEPVNFISGNEGVCGAEADDNINVPPNPSVSVYCANLKLKINNGAWQAYDFNATRTLRDYCVTRPNANEAYAFGPC